MSSAAGKRFNSAVFLTLFPRDLKPGLCGSDTTLGTLTYIIRCTLVPDRELCRKNASDDWRGHINKEKAALFHFRSPGPTVQGAAARGSRPSQKPVRPGGYGPWASPAARLEGTEPAWAGRERATRRRSSQAKAPLHEACNRRPRAVRERCEG